MDGTPARATQRSTVQSTTDAMARTNAVMSTTPMGQTSKQKQFDGESPFRSRIRHCYQQLATMIAMMISSTVIMLPNPLRGIARMYGARKVHVWFSGALRCMG